MDYHLPCKGVGMVHEVYCIWRGVILKRTMYISTNTDGTRAKFMTSLKYHVPKPCLLRLLAIPRNWKSLVLGEVWVESVCETKENYTEQIMRFTELKSDFQSWQCKVSISKTCNRSLTDFQLGHFQVSFSLARIRLTWLLLISEPERQFRWQAICKGGGLRVIWSHFFCKFGDRSYAKFIRKLVLHCSK